MLRIPFHRPWHLPTQAQVHPRFLPYMHLHASRRNGMRWLPVFGVIVCAGYGIAAYRQSYIDKQLRLRLASEREETERQRRNALLQNAYGDRTSLEELEQAMRVYESQARNE